MIALKLIVRALALLAGLGLTAAIAIAAFALTLVPDLPPIESIAEIRLKVPLRIYTADGRLIGEFGDERRIPIAVADAPDHLIKAILAAEDDAFYQHPGVDVGGVVRAAIANLRSGGHEQGASTITMQVARNYFLSREKTYTRKLKEVLLALRLEKALSKNDILELYLNKIFLGNRAYGFAAAARVYYGRALDELTLSEFAMLAGLPKAPSRNNPLSNSDNARNRRNYVLDRMFDLGHIDKATFNAAVAVPLTAKLHVTEVDIDAPYVAEMARQYMVDNYGEEAYEAGYHVMTTIEAGHQIAAQSALRTGLIQYDRRHGYRGPIGRVNTPDPTDGIPADVPESQDLRVAVVVKVGKQSFAATLRDGSNIDITWEGLSWARRYISARQLGPEPTQASDIVKPGDLIYVQRSIDDNAWRLAQTPEVAGALISLRPNTGEIVALTGGFDFYVSKFNRAIQAERQPGSNIKPFIYSAALERGFTAASLVSGAPIVVEDAALENVWRPENYSRKFFGPTRLRKALGLSLNLVSVRLLRAVGIPFTRQHITQFGFRPDQLPNGLSLALGTSSVTPLQMVSAYAIFANGGYQIQPHLIARVEDHRGRVIERADPPIVCRSCIPELLKVGNTTPQPRHAPRVISPENAFIMTSLMQHVIRAGTGRRALKLGRSDLAGKTGTTNNFHDAWFSGFNANLVTTVWVGFDQPADLGRGEAGSKAALPIWVDYLQYALKDTPETALEKPDSIISTFVHKETGEIVPTSDPEGYEEFFVVGSEPPESTTAYPREPTSGARSVAAPGNLSNDLF